MEPRSIIAFRNGSIGNTMVAIPALRAIRERWPNAQLSVVVDKVGFELLEHCSWIDRLIIYDKRGADRGFFGWVRVVLALRALRPTHAVLFKRFFRNGLLAYFSGARVRLGFRTGGKAPFMTKTVDYDESMSVLELNLRLAALLDVRRSVSKTSLFLSIEDRATAVNWLAAHGIEGKPVIVHYGGQTTSSQFIDIDIMSKILTSAFPQQKFVFVGQGQAELADAIKLSEQTLRGEIAVNLPLRVTASLMERGAFFVGMNSGPAHLAAAADAPGVVLYPDAPDISRELLKWKPASAKLRQIVVKECMDSAAMSVLVSEIAGQAAINSQLA